MWEGGSEPEASVRTETILKELLFAKEKASRGRKEGQEEMQAT